MRGAWVAAALVLGVAGAAAFLISAGGPAPTAPSDERPARRPPSDSQQIQALLDRRASALARGRRPAAATATAGQRSRDRRQAARVRRLGVRAVRFDARELVLDDSRATASVAITYALRGVRGRFTAERRMRLRRTGDGWRVASVRGTRRRPPWEVADFRRVPSEHFVVLAPPGVDPAAGGLLAALEAGYERMRALVVRGRLRRRYLVVVAADGAQARALTADIRGVESLAALTDTEVRETGPERRVEQVLGQRLIVVWPSFASAGPENGATVVIHELTHAVLAPLTSGRTPSWLTEGVALFVSEDRRVAEAARVAASLRDLSDPDAIARLGGDAQSAGYAYASAAAFFIAERYGRDRLLELYDSFNDPRIGDQREAVREVLGISLARLDADLRAWINLNGV